MLQAEKKLKSSQGFIGSLFGGSQKVDEAIELYVRAANSFKMAKNWMAAGKAFCEAAKVNLQQNVKHEAASNYNDAATCFKKADANGKFIVYSKQSVQFCIFRICKLPFKICGNLYRYGPFQYCCETTCFHS